MNDEMTLKPIARIRNDFPSKFGVPRQSGLVRELRAKIIFEPEFRNPDALRGIEGFSHIWLLWGFSLARRELWSPTVRPPRLGGNTRMGVFATRSPFRPNPIGLSSVELLGVEHENENGAVLLVAGADMTDGTPIYDIKPYLPYADCHEDGKAGYTAQLAERTVKVNFPEELLNRVPETKREALIDVLAQDPRPSYQDDPEREYGLGFAGFDIRFRVKDSVLSVFAVEKAIAGG